MSTASMATLNLVTGRRGPVTTARVEPGREHLLSDGRRAATVARLVHPKSSPGWNRTPSTPRRWKGVRRQALDHFVHLVSAGRTDQSAMLTHRFRREGWREAFGALATQDTSGAIKVAFDFG
jgi:hypothetical protein